MLKLSHEKLMHIRNLLFFAVLIICSIPAVKAEDSQSDLHHFYFETEDGMTYNGIRFKAKWPDSVQLDIERTFPQIEAVISGIYCEWKPLAGNDQTYLFAACVANGQLILVGAEQQDNEWHSEIISQYFFRREDTFEILMKPTLKSNGSVSYYAPAVKYNNEWFCFLPTNRGFIFNYYEREIMKTEQVNGVTHIVIELHEYLQNQTIEASYVLNGSKTLVFSGVLSEDSAIREINASSFPTDIQAIQDLCEPSH